MANENPQGQRPAGRSESFAVRPIRINRRVIVRLPAALSAALPSRGMVMARGTLNGVPFQAPLEPDGTGGHWFFADEALPAQAETLAGQTVNLTLTPIHTWPEPIIPEDIITGIAGAGLLETWNSLTTKGMWEWIRWIRATANPATRQKRITVACDKLRRGERRPCCFNSASCTVPEVSQGGVLKAADDSD